MALTAIIGTLAGCKENTIFGTSVLPSGDSLNTVTLPDTLTVQARSFYDDTALTNYPRLKANRYVGTNYFTVGVINTDPVFGKTTAGFAFEPAASATNFTFGTNLQIDSMVLVLPYSGYSWGDTVSAPAITLRAYQLGSSITDSFLYSSRQPDVNRSRLLGQTTFRYADLKDSVQVGGVAKAPHVRMRLNEVAFLPLLQAAIAADTLVPSFVNVLKGIYVEPDASQAGSFLPYFIFNGGSDAYLRPGIIVYYKNATASAQVATFPFNPTYSDGYTTIRRDYSATPAYRQLFGNADTTLLMVQNAPGAAIDFRMPNVKYLPRAVYNRAQIILTAVDTSYAHQFPLPKQLVPSRVNPDGSLQVIADRQPEQYAEPEAFVDGALRKRTIGGLQVYQYVINFPRELQQAVANQKNVLHLRINGTKDLPAAFGMVAGGRTHPVWKMQVIVSYSTL